LLGLALAKDGDFGGFGEETTVSFAENLCAKPHGRVDLRLPVRAIAEPSVA